MTTLERRALLGDKRAQEECTRRGIILPCPFCGNKNTRISNWGMLRCWCPECLGKSEDSLRERDAVKHWNTRPAPPIGRCGECGNAGEWTDDEANCHTNDGCFVGPADFCSQFEPKDGE